MADTLTQERRSRLMSRCKGKNTKPEKIVRSLLHGMGYRFRLHRKDLPGSPDILLPKHRTAIFVHGCFWHHHPGCKKATMPKDNAAYWTKKMTENLERDERNQHALVDLRWNVFVVWQCATEKDNLERLSRRLTELLESAC